MRVAVIGAGVAGASSAIALRRIGAEVTVYESYEDPAGPIGSFLSLAANGLRAVGALDCLPQVQRAGFTVPRQRMWSGGGKLLGDVARGRRSDDPLHSVTLMRGDLVRILRDEAVRTGARIVTGRRMTAAPDADLIVGADGIWSMTRRAVDPAAPEPTYAGLYAVSGISTGLELEPGVFNMIFARNGAFIYLPAPDGTVWWSAQVAAPQPSDLSGITIDDLAVIFGSEPQAERILRATTAVHGATENHILARVPRRYDDTTVLIGDAAHPVGAGQGASMALEDSVVLAREISRTEGIPAALRSFDDVRSKRLDKMAATASANRDAKIAGPIASRFRNAFMPYFFPRFYEKATGWLYDYDPGTLPSRSNQALRS